jgi:hypothetical protein
MQQSAVFFVLFESEYVVKNLKLLKAKQFVKHTVEFFFWQYSDINTDRNVNKEACHLTA